MIEREKLLNALREKGYAFKRQTERMELYRKKGSTSSVTIRKNALLDDKTVKANLRSAGYSDNEIDVFVRECTVSTH